MGIVAALTAFRAVIAASNCCLMAVTQMGLERLIKESDI
jgi:hypothetical protein